MFGGALHATALVGTEKVKAREFISLLIPWVNAMAGGLPSLPNRSTQAIRFGQPVSLDAILFDPGELGVYLGEAGFRAEEVLTRKPYEFELQMEKIYVFATKPEAAG